MSPAQPVDDEMKCQTVIAIVSNTCQLVMKNIRQYTSRAFHFAFHPAAVELFEWTALPPTTRIRLAIVNYPHTTRQPVHSD